MTTEIRQSYYNQPALWDEPGYDARSLVEAVEFLLPPGVQSVLDVGCGSGSVAKHLARRYRVVGTDLSREALRRAHVDRVLSSGDSLPFADKSMDLVLLSNVLEHLPEAVLKQTVHEALRVARAHMLIVSPYQEQLALGQVKCAKCGTIYHMNYHLRSVSLDDLDRWFSGEFKRCGITFWGDPWLRYDAGLWKLRQEVGNGWSQYRHAVCPSCGMNPDPQSSSAVNRVQDLLDNLNAELVSFREAECDDTPLESEVAVLFSRCDAGEAPAHPLVATQMLTSNEVGSRPHLCVPVLPGEASHVRDVRLTAKHNWTLELFDARRCHSGTGSQDIRSYICVNEHAGWGDRMVADGRGARLLSLSSDPRQHGIFLVPRAAGRSCVLTIFYKDSASGPVQLQVYDSDRGYVSLGHLENLCDGKWKQATFVTPRDLVPTGHGFLFNLVGEEQAAGSAITVERIVVNGHDHRFYAPMSPKVIHEGDQAFLSWRLPQEKQRPLGYEWCLEFEIPADMQPPKVCYGVHGGEVVAFPVAWNQLLRSCEVRLPGWWGHAKKGTVCNELAATDPGALEAVFLRRAVLELQFALEEKNRVLQSRLVRWVIGIDRWIRSVRSRY